MLAPFKCALQDFTDKFKELTEETEALNTKYAKLFKQKHIDLQKNFSMAFERALVDHCSGCVASIGQGVEAWLTGVLEHPTDWTKAAQWFRRFEGFQGWELLVEGGWIRENAKMEAEAYKHTAYIVQMIAERIRPSLDAETAPAWKEELATLCTSAQAFAGYQDNTSFARSFLNEAWVKSNVPGWHGDRSFPHRAKFYAALKTHLHEHAVAAQEAAALEFGKIFASDQMAIPNLTEVEKIVSSIVAPGAKEFGAAFLPLFREMNRLANVTGGSKKAGTPFIMAQQKAAEEAGKTCGKLVTEIRKMSVPNSFAACGTEQYLKKCDDMVSKAASAATLRDIGELKSACDAIGQLLADVPDPTDDERKFLDHIKKKGHALNVESKKAERAASKLDDRKTQSEDVKAGIALCEQCCDDVLSVLTVNTLLCFLRMPHIKQKDGHAARMNMKEVVDSCTAEGSKVQMLPALLEEAQAVTGFPQMSTRTLHHPLRDPAEQGGEQEEEGEGG